MKTLKEDSKNSRIILLGAAMLAMAGSMQAGYPNGYYDSLEGKCGTELIEAVKARCINHTEISYSGGTWQAFLQTDVITINGVNYWWDMYSNERVAVSSGHPGLNVEHSVPNSWWGGTKNAAYKDLAHLNPSDANANSRKSNYPLAEVGSVTWTNGVSTVGTPKSGQGGSASYAYEPADEYKGDFARAYMYMFTVYNDINWKSSNNWMYDLNSDYLLRPWAYQMLMRWANNDPVGQKEIDRNDGIYETQGNRNPFIDLPTLASHIWGANRDVPFSIEGDVTPGTEPGDDVDYEWLSASDPDMGCWTIEDVALPESLSYIWTWKEYNGSHYLNASAYANGTAYEASAYAWSPAISMADVTKANFSFEHAAKFQTTCKDLCAVAVKDIETEEITLIPIVTWPSAGSWSWAESGNIDLKQFAGKNIKVGFHYGSSAAGADTWEIRNVELHLTRTASDVLNIPSDDDDSNLVELWGNVILAPQGARIFDLNGREMGVGVQLHPGLYIVTKPTFNKAIKVIVR